MEEIFGDPEGSDSPTTCNFTINCSSDQFNWIQLYDTTPEAVIVPCVFACILLIGVVGNALLILSFARHKTLNTPHNALVVNLASGDFIFLLVSLPFNSIWFTIPYWPFGVVICKISHFAECLATAVAISSLSVLSIERCLIVTGKNLWRRQKQGTWLLMSTIWLVSILISVPNIVSANIVDRVINNNSYSFCHLYDNSPGNLYSKVHVVAKFVLLFCLPLLIIGSAYTIIAIHLLLRGFPLSQSQNRPDKAKSKYRLLCFRPNQRAGNSGLVQSTIEQTNSGGCTADGDLIANTMRGSKVTEKNGASNKKAEEIQMKTSIAIDDDKSSSPDSCTEITEFQQTPQALPFSFVYTGELPTVNHALPNPSGSSETSEKTQGLANSAISAKAVQNSAPLAWKETTPLNSAPSVDGKRGSKHRKEPMINKRRRLAFTVLMLIVAFAACWTPRYVYLLWFHLNPEHFNTFWYVFKIVGFCLSFSYSAVNPLVFYILDNVYRSFVNLALCSICLKRCRPYRSPSNETVVIIAERDYNATIAMTDLKSKGNVTEL